MNDTGLAGAKRPREGDDAGVAGTTLDTALNRVAKHLLTDPPGSKLEKASSIMLKLMESSLKPDALTSGMFTAALIVAAGDASRARNAEGSPITMHVFAQAEERLSAFNAQDHLAIRALALRCFHLRRIADADEPLDFNRRMRPLNEALQSLRPISEPPSANPAHVELFHSAILDCLEVLLDLNERRPWAQPTVKVAFRIASERRLVLSETLRSRLDGMTHLLHARQTAAGSVQLRSYAGGALTGAGAGAMSGKHHPLLPSAGGGLMSSARGAAVVAVPGVKRLLSMTQSRAGAQPHAEGARAALAQPKDATDNASVLSVAPVEPASVLLPEGATSGTLSASGLDESAQNKEVLPVLPANDLSSTST